MTLADRLSLSYLGALGLILVGFSSALLAFWSASLDGQVDERLGATLDTLAAMVEDERDGLEWETRDRPPLPGQEPGVDQVRWRVLDDRGREVDRSRNLGDSGLLGGAIRRRLDRDGHPWRVASRTLQASRPTGPADRSGSRPPALVLLAGLRLDPVERALRNLVLALALISGSLWAANALIGRRLCRGALAPLIRMAAGARELGADEPGNRLLVPPTGDELEDLARAFNGLLDRWHEALVRQSRFAGDASHQLRTPLAALIGQSDVALRRDRSPEEYRQALARVRDQAGRLARIVESLLYLARADESAGPVELDEFDLIAWADARVERRRVDGDPGILRWHPPDNGPIPVRAHPVLLAEALDNLLDNARDHGEADAPVDLRVRTVPGFVDLTVEDRGPGIDPADLGRVFEPFYRSADARRSAPRGVGLGLAVARRIVRALGGSLEVESRVGEGSRFTIRLPTANPGPTAARYPSPGGPGA